MLHQAIGKNLYCIFVDNGLLRKDEFESVLDSYKHMGLNVTGVDAKQRFYDALEGLSDPEKKRKAIGRVFIEVFDDEPYADDNAYSDWLDVKGIELPKTYELTDRHEKLIGAFATALATIPDEYLYDLIVDDGYDKPYPQRWI